MYLDNYKIGQGIMTFTRTSVVCDSHEEIPDGLNQI